MKAGKFTINLPLAGKHNRPANFSSPGDVDVAHARLWETGGEHRVEADHVEKVQSVVILHLLHVCHVLQGKLIKVKGLYIGIFSVKVILTVILRPSCPRVPAL